MKAGGPGIQIEMIINQPAENEDEKAPEELPQIEPAPSHLRVHAIPGRPLQKVAIKPVIGFNMPDDRLDGRTPAQAPREVLGIDELPSFMASLVREEEDQKEVA